jgi:DNA-binding NtrC family response regulator
MDRHLRDPDPPITVAVVSRDRVYLDSLSASLGRRGLVVRVFLPAGEVPPTSLEGVDVLVLDTDSLTASDLELATDLQRGHPLVEVVAIAGDSPVADAVKALRAGVFTVLQHPVADGTLVEVLIAAGRRHRHARERLAELNGAGDAPRSPAHGEPALAAQDRGGRDRT